MIFVYVTVALLAGFTAVWGLVQWYRWCQKLECPETVAALYRSLMDEPWAWDAADVLSGTSGLVHAHGVEVVWYETSYGFKVKVGSGGSWMSLEDDEVWYVMRAVKMRVTLMTAATPPRGLEPFAEEDDDGDEVRGSDPGGAA